VVKKFKITEINGYNMCGGKWPETDRQTDRLPHLIMKVNCVGSKAKGYSSKTLRLLVGLEQVTRPNTLQAM